MVTPLEALNNFISKDEYDDLGKYHEPDPNHMTPGYGTPNKKSTFPKQTGDFTHAYESFETQPHSVTFKYQGGVKAVHQNHYSQADHFKQQSYHVEQAKTAKAAGADAAEMGHTNAAAAHGYQARNMVQPGHDTLTFSRVGSHHGGRYDDGAHLPWVGKANENSFRDKLLKNPDIIPPKGQRKEEVVDALIKQKIRQKDNNKRANNLLNAEIADPGGGSKAGGDSAMYRLSEFVQKPIEAAEDDAPPIWGKPKDSHIKKANRLIELVDIDPDEVKIDDPPKHKSKRHTAELEFIKQFKDKLDDESFIDEVSLQDDDLEEPFKRYIRDNDLELSSDEKDNLEQINRDASTLVHKFKIFYNRQRPHQADDNIDEIENTAGKSPSYPSGHSTNSYVIGEYLANKFPKHADELRNIGKKVGLNRVIVGLHYPSDHIAGVELGQQVVRGIPGMTDVKKSDAFMDELFKYMEHREELFKDMTQIGTQDILDGVRINKEDPEPVDNYGDLTQAHFDAAGLKMGPEDTWTPETERALKDSGMYNPPKPKPKKPIAAVNPEIPTAPPKGDLPNLGTNGLGKLPPNGIYVSQEKPPKDAQIYQTEGGASYWIPDKTHHWGRTGATPQHRGAQSTDDAKTNDGAGWSHNVSFTDMLPDGVVPKENAIENRAMLRGKIDQDHIPHQTKFSKEEFKNGIETPFELKLPGGLRFGSNTKVTYSRAFRPVNGEGRAFVVVDIKSDSRHARHAFYTRTGTGDGGETTKIAGVDVNAGGPTGQGSFAPTDGVSQSGWYNKGRYSWSHKEGGQGGESQGLPWHIKRYGNDAIKVIARTLDAVGVEGIPGHEDNNKDYEIKSKYEAPLDSGQINMLIGSRHALSNNVGTDSDEFKDSWKHYSELGHTVKNSSEPYQHKPEGALSRFMNRLKQKSEDLEKESNPRIPRKYIDSMKKKTQEMEKHTEEHHTVEHISEEKPFSMDAAKESLDEQLKQIKNKIETGDYDIKKSEDIFLEKAPKYDINKVLTEAQFKKIYKEDEKFTKSGYIADLLNHFEAKRKDFVDKIGGDEGKERGNSIVRDVKNFLNQIDDIPMGVPVKQAYTIYKQQADQHLEEAYKLPNPKKQKNKKEEIKNDPPNKPDPPNNSGSGGSKQEYKLAHQNRINAVREAREELNSHLDSFNKVKATAADPTFQKMGHMEKFNNARDKYDKAVAKEQTYRNTQENRGTPRPNPTEDEEFKDLFSDVTAPEYTDADNKYIEEKNKLINLGREKGLIDWYYEQNHSSVFDEHHENREGSEAELLNQPLSKLRVAFKNLAKTIPDDSGGSDGGDDGGTEVSQVSDAELRAHEREMVKRGEEISDKYFDKDEDGRFVLKPDLDKHDVLMGMREMERLMNEDWKGEDNKFNREEDGSVTDNDDRFAKEQNRKKVLGNKSFNQLVAIGAQIGSQGLVQRFGMTPKQAENVVAKIHQEYREEGENFMSDEHRKKVDEEGKAALEESNKAHADYKLHAEGTSKDPTRPQDYVSHAHSPASSATVHTDEEAKDFQKPMTVADVASAQAEIDKMKISDAEKEKERIRQGLPPTDSTPPMFQDEEGNPTVQAVWHKETHKWAKPDTLQTGKGSSGHYDTMPDDSFIHISDNEFNNMQGDTFFPEGEEMRSEKYNTLSTTPKGGMIAYKDKDGNMQYFRGKSKLDAFHNQEHLAEAGQDGTSSENHAKRQANVEALIDHAVSNFQGTAFGGKQAYRIDSITGSIQKVGDVDFKPRQVFTKVGKVSRLGRRVASSLKRFGDKYESNLRNEDAILFINDAKKYARRKGKRPTIIVNDGMNRTRFSKFTRDQQKEIARFANLHAKNPNGTYKRLLFPED